jgi:type I restriction-modification system DNA methylase subunit
MSLFQKSVLNQYLKTLDKSNVSNAYQVFKSHFHNATIQQHIRNSKEEQYQGEFLIDLFVNVLGYTKNPQPNFNLQTEQKNETDSKKADGAILKDGKVIAVIELKGTNTTDLNTVTAQAFGYKNNQKECKYIIISNFEKLRFYINNAIDFEEFNLFTLTEEEFTLLYLCLYHENILTDVPEKIKQASAVKEENVTKQLYKDYSEFKRKLFADIVHLNPERDKLLLFKKSQKLLDRILFILFAEDRGLMPPNSINTVLNEWEQLQKLNVKVPLYDRFKNHFNYLNTGYKNEQYEIFAYNGGLFAPDEMLDNILISDNLLLNYTPTLAKYDYESEVDVNVLGHIFEHSLNDIEEVQAELEQTSEHAHLQNKKISKRKKDGVFYTPKYITKYIVENTVGTLYTEKRNEFGVIAENYTPDKRLAHKKELKHKLDTYQEWLLNITILDPACGSGAFLNQALEFLIQEHKNIDELRAQLLGESMILPDHEVAILENNIFGVDLNEESVEIARLSLWLRTAQKGRKLNSLNNNIKCGNSLIDDISIAGDKAFNWKQEFKTIFEKGGFDVVIGNPPYVNARTMDEKSRIYLNKKYPTLTGAWDLYVPFLLKAEEILKNHTYGWIIPNKLLISDYAEKTLSFLKENGLNKVINISHLPIFENVGVYPIILINNNESNVFQEYEISKISQLLTIGLHKKLQNNFKRFNTFKDLGILINSGTTGFEAQKIIPLINEKGIGIDFAVSGSFDPYLIDKNSVPYMKKKYKNPTIETDSKIVAKSKIEFWLKPKVVVAGMTKRIEAYYTTKPLALGVGVYGIYGFSNFNPLFILSILNSKFLTFYLNKEFKDKHLAGGYLAINKSTIEELPLVELSIENQQPFIEKADTMLQKNKELQTIKSNVVKLLQSRYSGININTKLNNWNELTFKDFCKELEKQKIKLSISEQAELMHYFEQEQAKANSIQQTITQTDKEIDNMVYKLYELTEEEITIVEQS